MYSPIFLRYSFLQKVVIFVHNLRAFLRGHSEKFEACRCLAGEVPFGTFLFWRKSVFPSSKRGTMCASCFAHGFHRCNVH